MIGFFPFKTAENALANINSVSEGIVHDDLKLFLDTNLPKVDVCLHSDGVITLIVSGWEGSRAGRV